MEFHFNERMEMGRGVKNGGDCFMGNIAEDGDELSLSKMSFESVLSLGQKQSDMAIMARRTYHLNPKLQRTP